MLYRAIKKKMKKKNIMLTVKQDVGQLEENVDR